MPGKKPRQKPAMETRPMVIFALAIPWSHHYRVVEDGHESAGSKAYTRPSIDGAPFKPHKVSLIQRTAETSEELEERIVAMVRSCFTTARAIGIHPKKLA